MHAKVFSIQIFQNFHQIPPRVCNLVLFILACFHLSLVAAAKADLLTLNDNNSACSSACSSDASTQTDVVPTGDVSLQTELSVRSIGELEEGYLRLSRGRFIKEPKELTEENLQMDDTKVKFYTGLPSFCILKIIFEFISPYIKEHHRSSLSNFHQFLMVQMKLRLNLFDQDLAYRFGVAQSTVSKIMKKWVNVMYVHLKPLVQWPQREQLRREVSRNVYVSLTVLKSSANDLEI